MSSLQHVLQKAAEHWAPRLESQQLTIAWVRDDGSLESISTRADALAAGARLDDSRLVSADLYLNAGGARLKLVGLAEQWAAHAAPFAAMAQMLTHSLRDAVTSEGAEDQVEQLSMRLGETYEELSLIYQLSGGMRVNRRPEDFFKQACFDVAGVISARGVGVAVGGDSLVQFDPNVYGQMAVRPNEAKKLSDQIISELAGREKALLLNDLKGTPFEWFSDRCRNLLAVGMHRHDKQLGVLFALDRATDFDSQDIKLLSSIGNEAAIYLENTSLYEDVRDLMMGLLHSLVRAVDAKDAYTCGHSERVALYSRALAEKIGLSENQVERVYMAGLLHDVGKIGVPEAVLRKAGKLDDAEFAAIKLHPEIGARILKDVRQVQDIIPGVLHHHERYDGHGYPHKLAGGDIPLMGRIICLADCFDAMTSNRTYRTALPIDHALTEIKRCAGVQFDPTLADAFVNIGVETLNRITLISAEKGQPEVQLLLKAG